MRIERFIFSLLFALTCATSAHATEQPWRVYLQSDMYAYSETSSVKQIVKDDLEGKHFDGGEHSFTHNLWELGMQRGAWRVGYFLRYDYALDYSEDTAELIYADKNDLPIEQNREYQVVLDVVHARSSGLRLAYDWAFAPAWSLETSLVYLQAKRFQDGEVNGFFTAADDSYTGQLALDYYYDQDKLLHRVVERPTGRGYAFDLHARWQATTSVQVALKVQDLFNRIDFKHAPYTQAAATSDRVSFDEDGRIDVKPVLSGREGYTKHTLRLPVQTTMEAAYQHEDSFRYLATWHRYGDLNFPAIGMRFYAQTESYLHSQYDFQSRAVSLGWHGSSGNVSITSDHWDLTEARTFGLGFGWSLAFD